MSTVEFSWTEVKQILIFHSQLSMACMSDTGLRKKKKGLKCKIFTFENKKYGVRYMDTVSLTSANYCEFFKAVSQESTDNRFVVKGKSSDNTEINCEIEDHVIVRRNIAYPNTPDVQQNILNSLSKHLEDNYHIKSIALAKTDEVSQPGRKKFVEEEITIFIKDHLSYST